MPDESFFAKLENKSLKEQHQFMAKYTFESVPVLPKKRNVEVGDHLRLEGAGKSYTHHAVCTEIHDENITIAEYTGPIWSRSGISQSTSCSDSGRLGEIIKTTLSYYDLIKKKAEVIVWPEDLRRFSPDEIVKRAYQRLGENYYSPTKNNCEHFVTWCICGLRVSLQVKSWHVALVETLHSMLNTKTAGMVIANVADEIVLFLKRSGLVSNLPSAQYFAEKLNPLIRENSKWLLLLCVFIDVGIGVYELYEVYEEYKGGKYQGSHEEIVKKVFLIILKGVICFGLVYLGLKYGGVGGFIEAGICVYELKKACDQWWEGILIRSGWEFTVKVIEILTKGFFRFFLGYLGSTYSDKIFSKIEEYLRTLSKLKQSLVCGAVGGCLGHLVGVVITWIVENFGDIINSG
ncbi:uncharacterized protein LOC116308949 [Actinia tenebrosa]|uniref:Uncharacterized protein LOC116308949 n=1 Tax=Actinia tenebrosa TaxID=6105 RepID=A0A6P8JGB0_ACTTE|nr:uncharacterized protein LOC116308949 [Actinia tenebrosa]